MIATERRTELIKQFGRTEKDSGATEVQVAILSERIGDLAHHFEAHKLDHHSKRGLMKLIGKRKRLLRYLQHRDEDRYKKLITALGLRK
ncbi:MAG: 30S ribosomal protein S15 [Bacteriovoracales bacterium]|nr:30S ribosomal protein S15 [Bacteriovoracales bacterium]